MSPTIASELLEALRRRPGEALELHRRFVNPAFAELLSMAGYGRTFVRAQGMELEDLEGARYLDFVAGYGSLNFGHNPPPLREALTEILAAQVPSFAQVDFNALEGLAAERLANALPSGLDKVFFCSSGTEAVEAGIKLARAATGRRRMLSCEGAYHGLTLGALSLHGSPAARRRFEPLLPGNEQMPFDDLQALERELKRGEVAAFVVEPILGEGGAIAPRPGFLPAALELCHRHGALLILDEVQTGMGRTGRTLACEWDGVVPDAVALAKSLGGGLVPVGALVARDKVFRRAYGTTQTCQDHNNTFGGGALAMTAVLASLALLERERLAERAETEGRYLREQLERLAKRHKSIREVRGRGLLLGIKFEDASRGLLEKTPLKGIGQASSFLLVQSVALRLAAEHRILAQSAVNDPGVLKVTPPLIVTREQSERFVAALDRVLGETGHAASAVHLAGEVLKRRL